MANTSDVMQGVLYKKGGAEVQLHSFLTSVLERGEWLTSHLGRFSLENEPRYRLNARLGGPQRQSGCFGEEMNVCTLAKVQTSDLLACTLFTLRSTINDYCIKSFAHFRLLPQLHVSILQNTSQKTTDSQTRAEGGTAASITSVLDVVF